MCKKKQSNHVYRICERCVSKRKPKLQSTTEPEVEGWNAGSTWPRRRFVQDGTMYDTTKAKCVYTDPNPLGRESLQNPYRMDALYKTDGALFTYSGKVMQNALQLVIWIRQGPPERRASSELDAIVLRTMER